MPFAYYGAKHGLAKRYPSPQHGTIIEPFAGSAGYSVFHAANVDRVHLFDLDPAVVGLWQRVLRMTSADLDAIEQSLGEERTVDPILGGMAGSSTLHATLGGTSRQITPRMRTDWYKVRRRFERTLPHLHKFTITHGPYHEAPDVVATWHVDPPYQPLILNHERTLADQAGNAYRHGAEGIDYEALGAWCQTRRGLVMVCEQSPAAWLPFWPLARQGNGAGTGGAARMELIWRNDISQESLF